MARLQRGNDKAAESQLVAAVYGPLRAIARRRLSREKPGHSIQTTELVNEAYVRLFSKDAVHWQDRVHFFAVATQVMRRILVDHARRRMTDKRGGGMHILPLVEGLAFSPERPSEFLMLDEALRKLEQKDGRAGRVVELRFFSGLSINETAKVLSVSPQTVKREWNFGRAWLRAELSAGGNHVDGAMA
ncbi:MAG: sigma-70 family RNA polymerase sigma factor [bacterium]|nr:sigma-70 family RNA polymerase sigma factor [bacterium]